MASIARDKNGNRRILFVAPDGKRPTIRLGKVFQRTVNTVGGVIQAGEPVMMIVPEDDSLSVEAKIPPQEIDQVQVGQRVVLRFPAFNQRTTPELTGEVTRIGADVTQDERKNESYYTVRIKIPDTEIQHLEGLKLVAGMPVEADHVVGNLIARGDAAKVPVPRLKVAYTHLKAYAKQRV